MTDIFEIQCLACGTWYDDTAEACPYCGQPRPPLDEFEAYTPTETYLVDEDGLTSPEFYEAGPTYYDDQGYPLESPQPVYADETTGEWPPEYYPPPSYDDPYAVETGWPDDPAYSGYAENEALYAGDTAWPDETLETEAADADFEPQPRRFTWWRLTLGCLGLFLCLGVVYGSIGVLAAYHGLQEQAADKRSEAELHYQRGQEHLANQSTDLAIAEFQLAVSLNPGLLEAREALREAQRVVQAQPTPTSETRSAAAASILERGQAEMEQQNWLSATETLAQVRDLDPAYQPEQVSELLYTANYQLGLQLLTPDQFNEALAAFDRALLERPDAVEVIAQQAKISLYTQGRAAAEDNLETAVKAFNQLYRDQADYLDVKERLLAAYEAYGAELVDQEEWCLAEAQFLAADRLQANESLKNKAEASNKRCKETAVTQAGGGTPATVKPGTPQAVSGQTSGITGTTALTVTPTAASSGNSGPAGGVIYYAAFNPAEKLWEILAVPAAGGTPKVVVPNATMPAVSPDGRWLIYHSELLDAEGFHRFDLTSGEDTRITLVRRHILPRFGRDSDRFLLVAQEPATGRWQVQLGFVDGKSEAIILRDGRTPAWSAQGDKIAYQGTDPAGNNPGIYLVPFDGGEATRLTTHESDRVPDFSPDGSQIAYMSTKGGNWDIYTISTAGSAPRQITSSPGQDGLPTWSPDGSKIAYVSDAGGSWAIYVVDANGGIPLKVAPWDGVNQPDWLLSQIWWAKN